MVGGWVLNPSCAAPSRCLRIRHPRSRLAAGATRPTTWQPLPPLDLHPLAEGTYLQLRGCDHELEQEGGLQEAPRGKARRTRLQGKGRRTEGAVPVGALAAGSPWQSTRRMVCLRSRAEQGRGVAARRRPTGAPECRPQHPPPAGAGRPVRSGSPGTRDPGSGGGRRPGWHHIAATARPRSGCRRREWCGCGGDGRW